MKTVSIIGMGLSPDDLTDRHLDLIRNADVLIGGERLLAHFEDIPAEKREISKDLSGLTEFIKTCMQDRTVVVLASGDPLFYGIGKRLVDDLGAQHVTVYPNISSVAGAFARIKQSWHDAEVISLHGRDREPELKTRLKYTDKVAVLTDPIKNPAWLAAWLLENAAGCFNMCVLEQMGTPAEKLGWYEPIEAAGQHFSTPNVVVLMRRPDRPNRPENRQWLSMGMPEDSYACRGGLITKSEVRAVSIAKLRLADGQVMWDLGAGSGSVSIESSLLLGNGKLFAVEKEPMRIQQIRMNMKRFGVRNLETIQTELPDGLEGLPDPDRVFVGGGGRKVAEIITAAADRLKRGGRIVVNIVQISSIDVVLRHLKQAGLETEIVQIQISRGKAMPWGERLAAQNPVWIISGEKS